mgnify:CR=1 FL=1
MSRLAPIEAALFARLQTLQHDGTPTNARPFALVARYAGPLTRDGLQAVCGQYPALLLKRGRAKPLLIAETLLRAFEQRSQDVWTLVIVLEEGRDIDDAMQGVMPETPGLLPLHDVVEASINGFDIEGLWMDAPVRVVEYGDLDTLTLRGVAYAAFLELRADRSMEQATRADPPAVPFEGIDGGVNLPAPAPQPTDSFAVSYTP